MEAVSERIVVLTLNHIGDVLFTEPAIAALRGGHPAASLVVVTSPLAKAVLEHHPAIDALWVRERGSLRDWWRLVRQLRRFRPTLIVSLSPSSLGLAVSAWLSGAAQRYGFSVRPFLPFFFTTALPCRWDHHVVNDYLALAEAAGGKVERRTPQVTLLPEERAWGTEWLKAQGWEGEVLLGCHPFSSVRHKEWGKERFAAVLRWGQEVMGWRPVIFGNALEQPQAKGLSLAVGGICAAGALTLRQFLSVASHCGVFIGGDSGPTHLVAALGMPTIALYGPTDPNRTGPIGERVTVIRSPTGAMGDLSPATVQEAIESLKAKGRAIQCSGGFWS